MKLQIGVKLYGDDLDLLRRKALEAKSLMQEVRGVRDLMVEQQTLIPQLRIEYDRDKLLEVGLTVEDLNRFIETAMNGQVVSEVMQGQRTFDLVVRLKADTRENLEVLRRLAVELPGGGKVALESVAKIYDALGPNTIQREKVRRRIVIQCNTADRGLVEVVEEIQAKLKALGQTLPQGYYFEFSGQFESQRSASRDCLAFWNCIDGGLSHSVCYVSQHQSFTPSDGRYSDGFYWFGRRYRVNGTKPVDRKHGGIHFPWWHRFSQWNPSAATLSLFSEARRGELES